MNFASPEWFFLWLLLPFLLLGTVLSRRFQKPVWENLAATRLRKLLIKSEHPLPRRLSLLMAFAAIATLVLVLSRPQGDAGTKSEITQGRNIMIALDLSRSMRVQDLNPDRLFQAKAVIYELLESLEKDRIGLIGFAGTPFLHAPLTIDHLAIKETVQQIDEEWPMLGGSDLSAAVKLATNTLKETGQKNNALILISDGEENKGDLDAIIADAESAGVRIITLGVGTEDGGFIPHPNFPEGLLDDSGNKVLSRLQADVLRKLSDGTNGRYIHVGQGMDISSLVIAAIEGIDSFRMEGAKTRQVIEFFQWALLPAILFLMLAILTGTRWVGISVTLLGLFFLPSQELRANSPSEAKRAFSEAKFDQAREAYRALANEKGNSEKARKYRLGEGLSAYEMQDYRGARAAYSEALLSKNSEIISKAHEGMGNTLFQLAWLGLSGSRYPLGAEAPSMKTFDSLVQKQLELMAEADAPESGQSSGFIRIHSIIVNFSDAIQHYRSAQVENPANQSAKKNEALTLAYLKRLRELLKQEKEQTEQQLSQIPQAPPTPNPDPSSEGEGEDPQPGTKGEAEEKGKGSEEGENPEEKGQEPEEKGDQEGDGKEPEEGDSETKANPNESPKERASRLLSENADLQKGPVKQGRRNIRDPKKDW